MQAYLLLKAQNTRRCRVYTMYGMSFREYLKLEEVADLQAVSLEELVKNHEAISRDITLKQNIKVLLHFERYIKEGYTRSIAMSP